MAVVGRCSLCGGVVTSRDSWMSLRPPEPQCQDCKAVARGPVPSLPVIEMEPESRRFYRDQYDEFRRKSGLP